ncbi:SPOR domain-containing protein [Acidovorax sp. DW039]|uniref:SPOR domain-containing protein n=1 Tax=Acidovorax sp. DW039 TaxID=3095606 RepID=UPI00308727BB|nr:SPOR domain-containing protein [Acidovorax sp. DW039]
MSLDSPSDSAVNSLYRAALGPVNTERYLPEFARLDAMGRTLTSWNWAACVFTLGWMVYRQLWGAALVYVAVAEAVALLVFGLGRPLLQWPQAVEWGVVGAFIVAGSVIPGLYANALLHADIRKRVTKALAASATIPEGCDLLARQAPSRKRLTWVVAGHTLLVLAALAAYFFMPQGSATQSEPAAAPASSNWNTPSPTLAPVAARAASAAGTVVASAAGSGEAEKAVPPSPPVSPTTAASAAGGAAVTSKNVPPSAPVGAEDAPGPAPAPASATTPGRRGEKDKEPEAQTSEVVTKTAAKEAPAKEAVRAPEKEKEKAKTSPTSSSAAASGAAPAASANAVKTKEAREAKDTREAKTPKPAAKASAPAAAPRAAEGAASAASAPTVGAAAGYYINVGLFADEANARKAQSRLLNEGLPAFRQTLESAKGTRTRVRVGPYSTRAEADTAAASIRSLELDAVVFHKER